MSITDRQTQAVAEAIRDHRTNYCGRTFGYRIVFCDDPVLENEVDGYCKPLRCDVCSCKELAQAAIAASDAKYVPMLVEALKIADLAFRNGSVGPNAEKEKARVLRAAHKKILRALSQLPEDLR